MTALEAMALRKPVIAGERTPGVREVLGFGEGGVLVDVSNPKAIAEQMLCLARDSNLSGPHGRKRLCPEPASYRLETIVQQYESLYKQLSRN